MQRLGYLRILFVFLGAWFTSGPAAEPAVAQSAGGAAVQLVAQKKRAPAKRRRPRRLPYRVPTYAASTAHDIAEFDDPVVRAAAVEALGRYNGSVVVAEAGTGRILSIVNQRLAFSEGFQPCSTFKPVVALAALNEGVIRRDTMVRIGRRRYLNLTDAMAQSNNEFFEVLGRKMGFATLARYAREMGLGQPAGDEIFEEHAGAFPERPPARGGVGRMSSFGEGIRMTPLQLASLASTLANGGTVYALQYPRSPHQRAGFTPRVRRELPYAPLIPELRDGLLATVLYGTGRAGFDPQGDPLLGKTGTCIGQGSRLGWFVSYADRGAQRLVVVVLLRGNTTSVNGGRAADIAGRIFQRLRQADYLQVSTGTAADGAADANR